MKETLLMVANYLKGKKTYIITVACGVLGALEYTGTFTVPQWAWIIIYAAGLGALRAGINNAITSAKQ